MLTDDKPAVDELIIVSAVWPLFDAVGELDPGVVLEFRERAVDGAGGAEHGAELAGQG